MRYKNANSQHALDFNQETKKFLPIPSVFEISMVIVILMQGHNINESHFDITDCFRSTNTFNLSEQGVLCSTVNNKHCQTDSCSSDKNSYTKFLPTKSFRVNCHNYICSKYRLAFTFLRRAILTIYYLAL